MHLRTTLTAALAAGMATGAPPGRMIDLGSHRLHLDCAGQGRPTVVIENGFDEVSTDWRRVRDRVARTTRACTYDRAGYAWSEPGPFPRTFAQINLELKEALTRAGESFPLVLVGHSFGGGVARQYAAASPDAVVGLLLVDAVQESQRIPMGDRAAAIADFAQGRPIPEPRLARDGSDPAPAANPQEQAAASEREWSPEYLARWRANPQDGSLGDTPLLVLTRRTGGYTDGPGLSASELDAGRLVAQSALARLSRAGRQIIVDSGHDMQTEAPDEVAEAVLDVVRHARGHGSRSRDSLAACGK